MLTYRLPLFLDFLQHHYSQLYQHYLGRLTELFPTSEPGQENLCIAPDETSTESEDSFILQLWKNFEPGEE